MGPSQPMPRKAKLYYTKIRIGFITTYQPEELVRLSILYVIIIFMFIDITTRK